LQIGFPFEPRFQQLRPRQTFRLIKQGADTGRYTLGKEPRVGKRLSRAPLLPMARLP
jgi:hypothetical protein